VHELTRRDFVHRAALGLACAAAVPTLRGVWRADRDERQSAGTVARIGDGTLTLSNDAIGAQWDVRAGGLRIARLEDRHLGRTVAGPHPAFSMTVRERPPVSSATMKVAGEPRVETLKGRPGAARLSERMDGHQLVVELVDAEDTVGVTWRAILREGSRHVRQQVTLRARGQDLPVEEVILMDLPLAGASIAGTVKGSPVTAGSWFFGFEHPLSVSTIGGSRARCSIATLLPLKAGHAITYSSVIGVAADVGLVTGQVWNCQETAELAYDLDVMRPSIVAELGSQRLGGWRLCADIISMSDARHEGEQHAPAERGELRHRDLLV